MKGIDPTKIRCPNVGPSADGGYYGCVEPYVKFADSGIPSWVKNLAQTGIFVGGYFDFANPCPINNGQAYCYPDANPEHPNPIAEAYFEHGSNGGRVINSESLTPVIAEPGATDPVTLQPSEVRYHAAYENEASTVLSEVNRALEANDQNFQASAGSPAPYNFAFFDDEANPGDSASYPNWFSWVPSPFSLVQAPNGADVYPYRDYNSGAWLAGNDTVMRGAIHPVLYNISGSVPDTGVTPSGASAPAPPTSVHMLADTNVLGIMQEGMFDSPYRTDRQPMGCQQWASNENVEIAALHAGKYIVDYEHTVAPGTYAVDAQGVASRLYVYASILLTLDKPQLFLLDTDYAITANGQSQSGIPTPVEATLIPSQPLTTAPLPYDPSNPNGSGIFSLQDESYADSACNQVGGSASANCAFVREFKQCYLRGSAIGPCASVVFPDQPLWNQVAAQAQHPFPRLKQAYGHTLSISGFDIVAGMPDTGSLNLLGPAPPAAGTLIPGQTAYILTR